MLNTAKRSRTTVEALELKGYRYAVKNPAVRRIKLSSLVIKKGDVFFAGISILWVILSMFMTSII